MSCCVWDAFQIHLQLQVQRTSSIKPGKITKLFITHSHGDHSFGLPGLMCLMGQDRDRETAVPVDIYGPEGLRMWLRVAIRYSVSRIVPPYRVHELKDIPMAPEWEYSKRANRYFYRGLAKKDPTTLQWGYQGLAGEDPESWISRANMMNLEPNPRFGEVEGGRYDIDTWHAWDEVTSVLVAVGILNVLSCVSHLLFTVSCLSKTF
jgi:ribonuclease BN (tRNA processing enzyme)